VSSGKSLAATLTDNGKQRELLNGIKAVNDQLAGFVSASKGVVVNSSDADLMKLLAESANSVGNSVAALMDITSYIAPKDLEDHLKSTSSDLEELAEKELSQASQVISAALQKMLNAQNALQTRKSTTININLQEIQMTEAVLEAVHAIGKSTGTLVSAASSVQQEYNKLVKSHSSTTNANPYRRDPAWAKGLISASQQVAAAVTHLVGQSEKVATGEAKDEALIVAAKAVAAETAKLVTASSVKAADSKSNAHAKLNDAAKQVNAATRALQEAALASSDYKTEQEEEGKYALPKNKIQELNEQVEILKLERELERRKAALFANRKKEYEQKAPPEEEGTGKVAWRKSKAFQHKPTGLEEFLK
jgi:talin